MKGLIGVSDQISNVEFQIIFAHGLKWRRAGDAWTNDEMPAGFPSFRWPEELQNELHKTKIWRFEYSGMDETSKITDELIDEIEKYKLYNSKKIILITHSLGGIIAKELKRKLYYSESNLNKKILRRIKAVVFLSTPHNGSKLANELKNSYIRGNIAGLNVQTIKKLNINSKFLIKLDNDYIKFNELYSSEHIEIIENKETNIEYYIHEYLKKYENSKIKFNAMKFIIKNLIVPKKIRKYESIFIIDEESVKTGIETERRYVDEDHVTISKPKCENCNVYVLTKQFLQENKIY